MTACTSPAWTVGEWSIRPSLRMLRPSPRGSYATTVRSGKCEASVRKPVASIGWPIMTSGGRPSAVGSGPSTSYARSASAVSSVCVVVMAVLTAPVPKTHRFSEAS